MRNAQPSLRLTTWLLFLLANIVVSAVTSFLVVRGLVTAYSQPQLTEAPAPGAAGEVATPALPAQALAPEQAPAPAEAPAPTSQPQPPAPAQGSAPAQAQPQARVRIVNVVFPGQRAREAVILANEGEAAVDLTGWTLSNPRGQTYTFGPLVLGRNGFVNVYTTRGADSPTDLFWNLDQAVWQAGDVVTLKQGDTVVATFTVR